MSHDKQPATPINLPDAYGALRTAICEEMVKQGVQQCRVTYSGCGDEGGVNDVDLIGASGATLDALPYDFKFTAPIVVPAYKSETSSWQLERKTKVVDFHDACQNLFDGVMEATGNSDFADGDGGSGILALNCDGSMALDHSEVVERHAASYSQGPTA